MVSHRTLFAATLLLAGALGPGTAGAENLREPATGTMFPGELKLSSGHDLAGLGTGLREATIMKVDVYAIASYVAKDTNLGEDPGSALVALEVPKQLRIVFLRDIEGAKMRDACQNSIDKNFGKNTTSFAEDLETFMNQLPVKFRSGDHMNLTYVPGTGFWGEHNDTGSDPIDNPHLMHALWTIWFGEFPVNDGLKRDLLGLKN